MTLHPKKSLGQNFLKSKKAIHTMIDAAHVEAGDVVVEIGPGKGALTKPLLERGARVIAFELDQRMIEYLQTELSEYIRSDQLSLVHDDILKATIETYTDGKPYKIVANIPYYITNLILRTFLGRMQQPTLMSLVMQKEVAKRIVSEHHKESILSLSVQLYCDPRYIMKIPRHYFAPSPRVDSAIIVFEDINHERYRNDPKFEKTFFTIIKQAFSQKRKKAINNLEKITEKGRWRTIFSACNIDEHTRAEDISFKQWLQIVDKYIQ